MDKAKDFEKGWEEYKARIKQEIEEIEKDIVRSAGLGVHEKAKYLYDLGYRKIPENAVVLTKEEFEKHEERQNQINVLLVNNEILRKTLVEVCKETAEKFAEMAKAKKKYITSKSYNTCEVVFIKDIDEICKEITEGKE